MKKRILPVATVAIAAVALAGCSNGSGSTGGSGGGDTIDTLTIMAPYLSTAAPAADNDVELALEDVVGAKLDITWVPNASYGDKTNITLAGDDIPHVMVIGAKTASFVKNAEAGGFWDLTDKLDDYEYLKTTFPEVEKASSVNGSVYGIFRMRDTMRTSVTIRTDWLENLGLDMPETTEDLYNVAKAFTEQDPDGNGQDDTYGIAIPKWPGGIGTNSPFDAIETWYGSGNRYTERDGELVAAFDTDEWLDAVDFEKDLVDSGYINSDFATLDPTKWNEPFLNGQAGIIIDTYSRSGQITGLMKELDPDNWADKVDFTGNLAGPDGVMRALPTTGYSGFLAIPKAKVQTEEQLDQVLTILNKMNSPEAGPIINNGIEGVHYTLEDGLAVGITDVSEDESNASKSIAQLGMNVQGGLGLDAKQPTEIEQERWDKRQKLEESDYANAVIDPTAPYVSDTYVAKGAQIDLIVGDARLKYLAGQISKDDLISEIARWHAEGGDAILEELNTLAAADK
ncbi:lipoprotein LipO [Microbacterium sorbitolivorans]|uniref:Extracellular solute-binding protein n=1 Tax=Microbacterium sorbitolivorans TaxID=1867410 RepID=A0A367XY39_9MICO|nr:extracellular solute-binding protein [Microbacterium sorbitolivorans]RCK58513.1 extracellular solute-binding protein [Microbacterium sorbitolivorans]GGF37138.1 lipoprotein LipO [Microbacterium sorbitolivorans]